VQHHHFFFFHFDVIATSMKMLNTAWVRAWACCDAQERLITWKREHHVSRLS